VPEFEVGLLTIRSGTRLVRIMADDSLTARNLIQAEACTDDVETTVGIATAADGVRVIYPEGAGWTGRKRP
jgi:hypothetical protein